MVTKYNYHIIAIDDNKALLQTLKLVLGSRFDKVGTIADPKLIAGILSAGKVDAVILDMNFDSKRLDGSEGLFWLDRIKERPNAPAVILITAFGDINLAVQSMKNGADDFITKPWDNEELIQKIVTAIEKHRAATTPPLNDNIPHSTLPQSDETLKATERTRIQAALKATNHNISKAAGLLGISRRTLYNKILKHGL